MVFSIVRFPGCTKTVLSGESLYIVVVVVHVQSYYGGKIVVWNSWSEWQAVNMISNCFLIYANCTQIVHKLYLRTILWTKNLRKSLNNFTSYFGLMNMILLCCGTVVWSTFKYYLQFECCDFNERNRYVLLCT